MSLPHHPMRPLTRALRSLLLQSRDPRLWLPFLLLGASKAALLAGVARLDLLPAWLLAPFLQAVPRLVEWLHYPQVLLHLPGLDRRLDLALFVTAGALLQGWAMQRLAGRWTGEDTRAFPRGRRGLARALSLVLFAALLVAIPLATVQLMKSLHRADLAPFAALGAGVLAQVLLFAAPAFVVVHGMPLVRSVLASIQLLAQLPLALPLAVVLLAALHLPALFLREPAILAGASRNPDWILAALLAQIPADLFGALLAAGLAAHFALRSPQRAEP